MFKRLPLLPHYCRTLGLWLGFRYWRISNRCVKNPELVETWAARCQAEASQAYARGDNETGDHLKDWAEKLRRSYADYTGKKITVKGPNKPRHKIRIVHANGAETIVSPAAESQPIQDKARRKQTR